MAQEQFCTQCGAARRAGAAFCASCGLRFESDPSGSSAASTQPAAPSPVAPVAAPSSVEPVATPDPVPQPVAPTAGPPDPPSVRRAPTGWIVGAALAVVVVIGAVALSGGDDPEPAGVFGGTAGGEGGASEDDVLTMDLSAVEPAPVPTPTTQEDLAVGGSPDFATAAAITAALEAKGLTLQGIGLSVLPISGTDESLLVLELSEEAGQQTGSDAAGEELFTALLNAPELDQASVSQVAMIFRGSDEKGPYVATMTAGLAALRDAMTNGTEIPKQELGIQIDRGAA